MKKIKLLAVVSGFALMTSFVYAQQNQSSAQIAAELTHKTLEEIVIEKNERNVTYGQIAKEAGKLDEFKQKNAEQKKVVIDKKVESNQLSKEVADAQKKKIDERVATCDGTPDPDRERLGLNQGSQQGARQGNGQKRGQGAGQGNGQGRVIHRNN